MPGARTDENVKILIFFLWRQMVKKKLVLDFREIFSILLFMHVYSKLRLVP